MQFKLFVGIDVGKHEFHVALAQNENEKPKVVAFKNDHLGIGDFLDYVRSAGVPDYQTLICMEHTGVYIEKLVTAINEAGMTCWVAPASVIKFNQSGIQRGKTDQADAGRILYFCITHKSKARNYRPKSALQNMLSDLNQLRRQLVAERQKFYNFSSSNLDKAAPDTYAIEVYKKMVAALDREIDRVEKKIKSIITNNEQLSKYYQILISIPGIGPVIATNIILITEGFQKISEWKQMAAMIGSAPFDHSSGTSVKRKTRTSKRGNRFFKSLIFMGARSLITTGRKFNGIYTYLLTTKGKHHLWIMNYLINTLLKLAFTLVKKGQLYQHEMFIKGKKSWSESLI